MIGELRLERQDSDFVRQDRFFSDGPANKRLIQLEDLTYSSAIACCLKGFTSPSRRGCEWDSWPERKRQDHAAAPVARRYRAHARGNPQGGLLADRVLDQNRVLDPDISLRRALRRTAIP